MKMYDLWIDISNTPQVHMAKAIADGMRGRSIFITGFRRGETEELMKIYGLQGRVFGSDKYNPAMKSFAFAYRTFACFLVAPDANNLLSFENAIPIPSAKARGMTTILMLDNDIKYKGDRPLFQRIENRIKESCDYVIVPEVAKKSFSTHFDNVLTYPGFKEQIYLADFVPDPNFTESLPFDEYVVVRPESLTSLYVMGNKSIVPELCRLLKRENFNVVYLPRNREEGAIVKGVDVYVPPRALDGLNLVYHADAVLTGSGTMAREAAVLGVPAVSFFPGSELLAVDRELIGKNLLFHSRDTARILEYLLRHSRNSELSRFDRLIVANKIKTYVLDILNKII